MQRTAALQCSAVFTSSHAMTQIQDEFETSLENAESWMKAIHERLKVIDNTQGPRSALECRLRQTEKICELEPEGKLLINMVLTKAEVLLKESSEQEKHDIHVKLGKIKSMFEETTTYMTHCHSRIEWVWLHWNEYLKARDEFTVWVHNITLTLETDMELQLGLKEKRWQFEQSQVLLKDVTNQSRLLNHLLDEAAYLYNRIGDPSVDETVQKEMMAEYKQIKKKTQERTTLLEKIKNEHEDYEEDIGDFRTWLNSVVEKLKCCVGGTSESTEHRLLMLQEISQDVHDGGKRLGTLEVKSAEVIKNTSPLGAEKIHTELEELRRALAELKLMNDEEKESLVKSHDSESAFVLLYAQLEVKIKEFRNTIQRLGKSLQSKEPTKSDDELMALWESFSATNSALADEETTVEGIQNQLKDLFRFSRDVVPLSESVIAAMQEHQRAKNRAYKLCTETESALKQRFRNPLREYQHWKPLCERVLDSTSAHVSSNSLSRDSLLQIEMLLEESVSIKEKLATLQTKKDHMLRILGEEKASLLLSEVVTASENRASLHEQLLQRKNTLQSLASQSEEFENMFEHLHKRLVTLRIKAAKENVPQPDLVGKETQLQRLQMLQEELMKLHPQIDALKPMAESHPTHQHQISQLSTEYLTLQRSLEANIRKSKQNISNHWVYNNERQDIQHWIMVTRHELESYIDGSREWSTKSRERDLEVLTGEMSEKEIQLHQLEVHGQDVKENSLPEGAAHIQAELAQLGLSWEELKLLWETLSRSLRAKNAESRTTTSPQKPSEATRINQTDRHEHEEDPSGGTVHAGSSPGRMTNTQEFDETDSAVRPEHEEDPSGGTVHAGSSPGRMTNTQEFDETYSAVSVSIKSNEADATRKPVTSPSDSKKKQSDGSSIRNVNDQHVRRIGVKNSPDNTKSITSTNNNSRSKTKATLTVKANTNKGDWQKVTYHSGDAGDSPFVQIKEEMRTGDGRTRLLRKFEDWLQIQNSKLNTICAMDVSSFQGWKTRLGHLQKLQSRIPQGQHLFESLLHLRPSMAITENLKLEDLRYRWMLYKSKLRDTGNLTSMKMSEEPRGITKKSGGVCAFLHRVCCAAIPLQLLLLLLLLLAFLLPFMYGTQNCALSNNFARSFNLMLRYEKPPPT
uniref:Spectrin repeat containing nuclear envelope family member 3 n=1 Tax=Leptobrachium leishanense TaxID=445787 RepID=A0A8C5QCP9_9ANUR